MVRMHIDDFDVGVTLGTGSFGRVRFATHLESERRCAIKILKKKEVIRHKQVEHMLSEKKVLSLLSKETHPFIVELVSTFNDHHHIYVVLDYVIGGEFFSHLRNTGVLEPESTTFYISQVVLIFEHLHGKGIIYRDLKPENLLLDDEGYLRITDFGFAKIVEYKTFTLCGTPEYIAPEVLLNKGHGRGVDWWTLGILLYECLAGGPPFVDDDPMGIYNKILSSDLKFPKWYEKSARILTKKLLQHDLTRRYGCLRNGPRDVKKSKFLAKIDWEALLNKQLKAPMIPNISHPSDTSNFEEYPDSDEEMELEDPPPMNEFDDPFVYF